MEVICHAPQLHHQPHPETGSLGIFSSGTCPHWASSISAITFRLHHPGTGVPGRLLRHSLVTHLSVSAVWDGGGRGVLEAMVCLVTLHLWWLKELLIFQFVQLLTYCEDRMVTSKVFICWTRSQKSVLIFNHTWKKKKKNWLMCLQMFFLFQPSLLSSGTPVTLKWGSHESLRFCQFFKKFFPLFVLQLELLHRPVVKLIDSFCYGPSSVNPS